MAMQINVTVNWPSLYSPAIELSLSHNPVQPGGHYLLHANDIFRFTLYWTLIFHIPFYVICGTYAFLNFAFPPSRPSITAFPLETSRNNHSSPDPNQAEQWVKRPRPNVRRSRLTFALLVILVFLFLSLAGAVIGAAVVGFILAGVYAAGGFYMSTWVPFVWAVIQSLVGLLAIWPSVIDII